MKKEYTGKEDEFFHDIISKSKLQLPFSDFDDKVMRSIQKKLHKNSSISKDIKLSWIFFILGSLFGTIVSLLLPLIQEPVLGLHLDKLSLPIQILFVLLLVFQLDSLVAFYKRQSHKN